MAVSKPRQGSLALLDQLTQARVIDLSQPLHAEMPQLPGLPRYSLSLVRRHGDVMRGEGYSAAQDLLVTLNHAGTHIDALGHVSVNGELCGGLAAAEVQVGTGGLRQLGIETVGPIIRRGVLLDVAAHLGVPAMAPAQGIDSALLEACRAAAGLDVGAGDVVLIRTGWGRFWGEPDRYQSRERGLPGVDADGAAWLEERGIFATGADNLMYERFDPADNRLPVHSRLIQGACIHLIENLDLEELAASGLTEFAFVALPLRLVGATGAQVRPVALA